MLGWWAHQSGETSEEPIDAAKAVLRAEVKDISGRVPLLLYKLMACADETARRSEICRIGDAVVSFLENKIEGLPDDQNPRYVFI